MDVTATDVEQVRFPQGRKGYDPDVVDQFLDRVAASLRNMDERLRELAARNQSLEAQLNEQRESEAIMRRTLQVAQRAADETVAEAQARARELVATAEARAQETERRTAERVRELEVQLQKQRQLAEADIEALRQYYHDFTEKIAQVINDFAAVLQKAEAIGAEKPRISPSAPQDVPAPSAPQAVPAPPAPGREGAEIPRHEPPPPPQPRVAPPRPAGTASATQVIDDFGVREAEPPRPATAPEIPEE